MKIQSTVVNLSLMVLAAAAVLLITRRAAAPKLIRDARGLVYDNAESAQIYAEQNALFGI